MDNTTRLSDDEAKQELEQCTHPRVTQASIDKKIRGTEYMVLDDKVSTVAILTMENGFTIIGTSACASPENYNRKLGEHSAYKKAYEQIWVLEGYLLKERMLHS